MAHCPAWNRNYEALRERLRYAWHFPDAYPYLAAMRRADVDWIDRLAGAAGICGEAFTLAGRTCPPHFPYHPHLPLTPTPEVTSIPSALFSQSAQRRIALEEGVQPDYDSDPTAPTVWYRPSPGPVGIYRVAIGTQVMVRRLPSAPLREDWMNSFGVMRVIQGVQLPEPWHSALASVLRHNRVPWGTLAELGHAAPGVDLPRRAGGVIVAGTVLGIRTPPSRPDPPGFSIPGEGGAPQSLDEDRAGTPLDLLRRYQDGEGGYTGVHPYMTPLVRPVYVSRHSRLSVWGLPWVGTEEVVYPIYCNASNPRHWFVVQPAFGWRHIPGVNSLPAVVGHSCAPPGVRVSTLYAVWHGSLGAVPSYDRDVYQMVENGLLLISADPFELVPSSLCPLVAESPTAWENRLYGQPLRYRALGVPFRDEEYEGESRINLHSVI